MQFDKDEVLTNESVDTIQRYLHVEHPRKCDDANPCTLVEHMTDRELLQELVTGQRQLVKVLSEFELPPMLANMFGSMFKR